MKYALRRFLKCPSDVVFEKTLSVERSLAITCSIRKFSCYLRVFRAQKISRALAIKGLADFVRWDPRKQKHVLLLPWTSS